MRPDQEVLEVPGLTRDATVPVIFNVKQTGQQETDCQRFFTTHIWRFME